MLNASHTIHEEKKNKLFTRYIIISCHYLYVISYSCLRDTTLYINFSHTQCTAISGNQHTQYTGTESIPFFILTAVPWQFLQVTYPSFAAKGIKLLLVKNQLLRMCTK